MTTIEREVTDDDFFFGAGDGIEVFGLRSVRPFSLMGFAEGTSACFVFTAVSHFNLFYLP
jgi:hypothetical protein